MKPVNGVYEDPDLQDIAKIFHEQEFMSYEEEELLLLIGKFQENEE